MYLKLPDSVVCVQKAVLTAVFRVQEAVVCVQQAVVYVLASV